MRGVTHFKIGITYEPHDRLNRPDYVQLPRMCVSVVTENSTLTAEAETNAITRYKPDPRCMNIAPGGESAHHGCSPHFLYVVFGKPWQFRKRRRRSESE